MAFGSTTYILNANNELWGWGANATGTGSNLTSPQKLNNDNDWEQFSSGGYYISLSDNQVFIMAKKLDGTLWGLGRNASGQLGLGNTTNQTTFQQIPGINDVKKVVCGYLHSVILLNDGTVMACGDNSKGQLGDGTTTNSYIFKPIPVPEEIIDIAAAAYNTILLSTSGNFYVCGANNCYQTGITTSTSPVLTFNKISTNESIVKIEAGDATIYAISNTGHLYGWGNSGSGALLNYTSHQSQPVLLIDGSSNPVVDVICGVNNIFVKFQDRTWKAFGYNGGYALGIGSTTLNIRTPSPILVSNVKTIFAGNAHTIFITDSLETYVVGNNAYGQLGTGNTTSLTNPTKLDTSSTYGDALNSENQPLDKTYLTDQPSQVILTANPLNGLDHFEIFSLEPANTSITYAFSIDNSTYKVFNASTSSWETIDLSTNPTGGMTKAEVEALNAEQLEWLNGKTFYISAMLMTNDPHQTPVLSGIDAFVNLATGTPVVESLSVQYEVKSPVLPQYFVSRDDGVTWQEIEPDQLIDLTNQPEGNQLRIKIRLSNGQELYGFSYSWI